MGSYLRPITRLAGAYIEDELKGGGSFHARPAAPAFAEDSADVAQEIADMYLTPYTLHPTPYTLHPTPYTIHPTSYTLHPSKPTPFTLRSSEG